MKSLGITKNNEFVAVFARKNFIVDFAVFIGAFSLIAYFSVILALVGLFVFYFIWYNFKEEWHDNNRGRWSDGAFGAAAGLSGFLVVIFSLYLYTVTPYQYKEIGKITILPTDINYTYTHQGEKRQGTHREVDFDYNNETSDADLGKCKPGTHIIYEETVEPTWFTYLASDYILSCSGYMEVNKKIGK